MIGFPQPYMYYCNARIAMRCSQQYKQRMLEHGHIICSENSKTPLFEFELALLVGLQVVSSKEYPNFDMFGTSEAYTAPCKF